MTRALGLNGATLPSADLKTGIEAAKQAGFEAYEPRVPLLKDAITQNTVSEICEVRRGTGLSWLPLNALEGFLELEPAALETEADSVFTLAKQFAIPQVIVVPGKAGRTSGSPTAVSKELRVLTDQARSYGVSLLYELIGFATHVFPTLNAALAVSREADVPLVLDTFHLAISQAKLEEIVVLPPEAIGLVHLSDALTQGKERSELLDEDRVLPGEGGLPLRELLSAIADTGYRGPISVEVFHPKYGSRSPHEVAREARERTLQILQQAGWSN
jgi:sugar phosphate isomerase/epimerase